jgi:dipeptidyl aminopeptidase/acylaminoacyl peptidase
MAGRRFGLVGVVVGMVVLGGLAAGQQAASQAREKGANPSAKGAAKKPLDHDAYDRWNSLQGQALSPDGQWVLYSIRPAREKADATLKIRAVDSDKGYEVPRATSAQFVPDSRRAVYLIPPDREALKKAEQEKVAPEKRPKNRLEILDLDQGTTQIIERVQSFRLPKNAGNHLAYRLEKPAEASKPAAKASPDAKPEEAPGQEPKNQPEEKKTEEPKKDQRPGFRRPGGPGGPSAEGSSGEAATKKKESGTELVVRDLDDGVEVRFPHVTDYQFSDSGQRLAYIASTENGEGDGVFVVEAGQAEARKILGGKGNYKGLTFDESGDRVAFLSNRDEFGKDQPSWVLYHWQTGDNEAQPVASARSEGVPKGWWIADNRSPNFSKNGRRLFFGTAPRPKPEPKKDQPQNDPARSEEARKEPPQAASTKKDEDEAKVTVDIWHWKDSALQPEQLLRVQAERTKNYLAMVPTDGGDVVQLADETLPSVTVGARGNADVALGTSDQPYRISRSWEGPGGFVDLYLVDVATGTREKIAEKHRGFANLSPEAKYVTWWNPDKKAWFAYGIASKTTTNLTELLPHPAFNEQYDQPTPPPAYGSSGWIEGDKAFLVYDRYDLWAADPDSALPPMCVTDGVGRARKLRFRIVNLDPDAEAIDPDAPLLLSATHETTKAEGFFRDKIRGTGKPVSLIAGDESFGLPRKAKNADRLLLTRSTFQVFPDLWVGDLDFQNLRKLSDANPQQKEYRWGSAELVQWTSLDGQPLQGILYKPEGFDPKTKYPMIVYFYERLSDGLHRHVAPAPGSSSINYTFYVSRGYLVFLPDIPYRVGAPGQSAVNAILPGVSRLIDRGFVDPKRIGVQGHSWGGYQVAYLVTQSNLFACAEAGAPVSNMTSAYGGIRYSTGLSRMFQYERSQSRIGATLWEAQQNYIENSPIFWANRIQTPLLILHNDRDGAVPWTQGIELFVALRRLGKPCWLLNYNGEDHGLVRPQNRKDFAVRLQQFFDHYLKDAPPPVWLANGVPAVDKGKTLGLDLVEPPAKPPGDAAPAPAPNPDERP